MTSHISVCFVAVTLKSSGIIGVGSHFAVDFDEPLLQDGSDFTLVQSVLETISVVNNFC
jgi:hypothetical protein